LKILWGGNSHIFKTTAAEDGLFEGAYHHSVSILDPKAGEWKINAKTPEKEYYLMNVTYDSPMNDLLNIQVKSDNIQVNAKSFNLKVKTDITIDYYKSGMLKTGKIKEKDSTFRLPGLGPGVYNITIDVDGKKGSEKFKRTMIKSLYVDDAGDIYFH
jgi:hypothetical protein